MLCGLWGFKTVKCSQRKGNCTLQRNPKVHGKKNGMARILSPRCPMGDWGAWMALRALSRLLWKVFLEQSSGYIEMHSILCEKMIMLRPQKCA